VTSRLRFGTSLPGVQQIPSRAEPWEKTLTGAQMLDAARAAETAGFAYVSCSDHAFVPVSRAGAMGPTWYDAGSTLAFVAGATATIGLLSHVLVLPYRHPLIVAKQYGTLDHLSGGRVILGVGSGHLKPEFKVLGADYDQRGRVSDDYLRAIAAAWESDVAQFESPSVSFRDVMVWPRVARKPRPPIWVGGNSRPAVRRAARLGDGWVPWELDVDDFAAALRYAAGLRTEAGRTGAWDAVAPLGVAADDGADAVIARARAWHRAGATVFHVGITADSFAGFRDRLAWFGREVAPNVG